MDFEKESFAVLMRKDIFTDVKVEDKLLYRSKPSPEFVEVYLHSHETWSGYMLGFCFRFYGKKRPNNAYRQVIDFFLPIGERMYSFCEAMDAIIQDDPFEAFFRNEMRINRAKRRREYMELSKQEIAELREKSYTRYRGILDRIGTSGALWTGYSKFKATPHKSSKIKGERLIISYIPMHKGEKSRKPWRLYITKAIWGARRYEVTKEDQSKLNAQMDNDKCEIYLSTDQIIEMTERIFEEGKKAVEKY